MARVSEHRSSVQGNSDRISSQEAVMSMDGCGKAGLGCKPSGFLCFLCVLFFFFSFFKDVDALCQFKDDLFYYWFA